MKSINLRARDCSGNPFRLCEKIGTESPIGHMMESETTKHIRGAKSRKKIQVVDFSFLYQTSFLSEAKPGMAKRCRSSRSARQAGDGNVCLVDRSKRLTAFIERQELNWESCVLYEMLINPRIDLEEFRSFYQGLLKELGHVETEAKVGG